MRLAQAARCAHCGALLSVASIWRCLACGKRCCSRQCYWKHRVAYHPIQVEDGTQGGR